MRFLIRTVQFLLLFPVVGFILRNSGTVSVRFFLGYEWQLPLIGVMLGCFLLGVASGLLAWVGTYYRQRREIMTLKKDLRTRTQSTLVREPADAVM